MLKATTVCLVYFTIIAAGLAGYIVNGYKLLQDNFEPPYKAEVLRTVGLFVPPLGALEGYVNFDKEIK